MIGNCILLPEGSVLSGLALEQMLIAIGLSHCRVKVQLPRAQLMAAMPARLTIPIIGDACVFDGRERVVEQSETG